MVEVGASSQEADPRMSQQQVDVLLFARLVHFWSSMVSFSSIAQLWLPPWPELLQMVQVR